MRKVATTGYLSSQQVDLSVSKLHAQGRPALVHIGVDLRVMGVFRSAYADWDSGALLGRFLPQF